MFHNVLPREGSDNRRNQRRDCQFVKYSRPHIGISFGRSSTGTDLRYSYFIFSLPNVPDQQLRSVFKGRSNNPLLAAAASGGSVLSFSLGQGILGHPRLVWKLSRCESRAMSAKDYQKNGAACHITPMPPTPRMRNKPSNSFRVTLRIKSFFCTERQRSPATYTSE